MWGRIGGVAGNIRTNVSQLAKDVLEGDDDLPLEVLLPVCTSTRLLSAQQICIAVHFADFRC